MYSQDRQAYRESFLQVWQKHKQSLPLTPIETLIKEALLEHPEFIPFLEENKDGDFTLADNPFFHLGLHIAIREQVKINKPTGITAIYEQLIVRLKNAHEAEHAMMTVLTEMLWQAQQKPPTDEDYLSLLRTLL